MLPDRVSNPGPLTYTSGALPIALRGPAVTRQQGDFIWKLNNKLFAWIIFDTLLFISTLILHLQLMYWIPLFEGNKLVKHVLFLTLIQNYIRNSRGNAFTHQN